MKKGKLKKLFFACALLTVCAAVAGCAGRAGEIAATPTPAPDYMPRSAGVGTDARQQEPARFDWSSDASRIEAQIGRISEIAEARVVVTGDTALVGVKFDRAYRGEMTERIREMVAAEVMAADPGITTVAVTADDDDVEDIYEISDRMTLGREMDTLKDDIQEIVRNATTLR